MNKNIIIYGFMASGKTTIGKIIAEAMNLSFIDTDEEIEKKYNQKIIDIFETEGEEYFRQIESKVINQVVVPPNKVISVGGGAVLLKENLDILKKDGIMVMLDVPLDMIKERLKDDCLRPLAKGNIDDLYKKRFNTYLSISDIIINARTELNETCKNIVSILKKMK